LASSFNPFIDAARKHAAYISAVENGGGSVKKAWYRFSFFVAVISIGCFYAGCEVQKFYDQPTADSKEKIIHWRPPSMTNDTPGVEIFCGGGFEQYGAGKMFIGTPAQIPLDQFRAEKHIQVSVQGFPAIIASIVKDRLYLDLFVPTKAKPIQIEAGESGPLPFGWDWNSDSNTLEVVDDQNQAIFQEVYLNPNRVWIKGAIQSGGDVIELPEGGWSGTSMRHGHYNAADTNLKTIFLYPSSKHPHERSSF